MTPTVTVPNFEGPLGLLLELVEQGELEVTAISVGAITRQYLDRVATLEELSRHDLAQFLELGARLVFIKSSALLPTADAADLVPSAELRELNRELAEYRQFQVATKHLKDRLSRGDSSYQRLSTPRLPIGELPTPNLSLIQLGELFAAAIKRSRPTASTLIAREHYDQVEIAEELWRRAGEAEVALNDIIAKCRDRVEIIVTFLAVLELVRTERIAVKQSKTFDNMYLVRL